MAWLSRVSCAPPGIRRIKCLTAEEPSSRDSAAAAAATGTARQRSPGSPRANPWSVRRGLRVWVCESAQIYMHMGVFQSDLCFRWCPQVGLVWCNCLWILGKFEKTKEIMQVLTEDAIDAVVLPGVVVTPSASQDAADGADGRSWHLVHDSLLKKETKCC